MCAKESAIAPSADVLRFAANRREVLLAQVVFYLRHLPFIGLQRPQPAAGRLKKLGTASGAAPSYLIGGPRAWPQAPDRVVFWERRSLPRMRIVVPGLLPSRATAYDSGLMWTATPSS
jgi:hypothetical protein